MYFCLHMQTSTPFSIRRVRFRRWNRHGYSAFCSIGRCVNIGSVRKEIADQSLRKGLSTLTTYKQGAWKVTGRDVSRPDELSPEPLVLQTLGIALPQIHRQSSLPVESLVVPVSVFDSSYSGIKAHQPPYAGFFYSQYLPFKTLCL